MFVLLQSAMRGPLAGFRVVLGLCTGLIVHTTAVVVGVAGLIAASPLAFTTLKVAGAIYLIWLAVQAYRAPVTAIADKADDVGSGWKLYSRGIIMNVTNPKVTIFFLAFLPSFTCPESGPVWLQLVTLGAIFVLATLIVFGTIAAFAGAFGNILRRSLRIQLTLNRGAAFVFVALAVKLLMP